MEDHNPHAILGIHPHEEHTWVWRLYRPDLDQVEMEEQVFTPDDKGFFEIPLSQKYAISDLEIADPYLFEPTVSDEDLELFARGEHPRVYEMLGANFKVHQGVEGVAFATWAPNAPAVSVLGYPMRRLKGGVWELFVPGLEEGQAYQFEMGIKKSDPHGKAFLHRPERESVVFKDTFEWSDGKWLEERSKWDFKRSPINIYELHLGSWKKGLTYREMAPQLAGYVLEMGYTHVELMPIMEYPLDESWGYQVTGFFAPTSRYGSPEDFQFFVDHLHSKGVGVILDWVPAHFPGDDFALSRFDGGALYENDDHGFHPHWETHIFDYGQPEVQNFLMGSALYFLEKMHVDGLRVDAVASMLYLDYGRDDGQWTPNRNGGNENLEAIAFLKKLNSRVKARCPGAMMIAEESSHFPGITSEIGFDMTWAMGWMNDSLRYFEKGHYQDLTHAMSYYHNERFLLPLSHDEVVHGKKSLISKMSGDDAEQFAMLKVYLSYMMAHPGKKLLFMGGELAAPSEWSEKEEMPWYLLNLRENKRHCEFVKKLNHFYLKNPALWECDYEKRGFEWNVSEDYNRHVMSYYRLRQKRELLIVHNFSKLPRSSYSLPAKNMGAFELAFSTDLDQDLGLTYRASKNRLTVDLPPLTTLIFKVK